MSHNFSSAIPDRLAASLLALSASLVAMPVLAQDRSDLEATDTGEIIVTAQRRAETLQTVPISISAFSAEDLTKSGVTGPADLERVSPGVVFAESGRDGQVFMRGIGSTRLSGAGADPSTSIYIDGVYRSRGASALLDFVDIERVEILRGPQGTLYGRNSTGGAVRYITEAPGHEWGGRISAGYGNYDAFEVGVMLDMPFSDSARLRAAFQHSEHRGYTKNLLRPGETFGRKNLEAGRLALRLEPAANVTIDLHGGFAEDNSDQTALKHYIDPNHIFGLLGAEIIADPRKVKSDYYPRNAPIDTWYVDGTVAIDLGSVTLTSITGYNEIDTGPYTGDLDVTEITAITDGFDHLPNGIADGANTFSQELNLSSNGNGPLSWTTGLFYLKDDTYTVRQGLYIPLIPALAANHTTWNAFGKVDAYAGFANASYFLTDSLRINAGIRYSHEKKEIERSKLVNFQVVDGPQTNSKSWDSWTPRVGLDFLIDRDKMLYASYSKGFKSGAFNANSFDPAVNPEKIDAFEAGAKLRWPEARFTLNTALFHYNYKDLQVQGLDPDRLGVEIIRNAANAKIDGAEVEADWRPIGGFDLKAGLAWLNARYTDFPTLAGNLEGNKLPNAPAFTSNLGAAYTIDLSGLAVTLSGDWYHSSKRYLSETNNPTNSMQNAFDVFNARLAFKSANDRWEFAIWGKNLSDEVVFSRTVTQAALLGQGFLAYLEPPRTYGAELKFNF